MSLFIPGTLSPGSA